MTTGNVDWNGTLQVVLQVPGVGAGTMPGARGGQLSSPAINDMAQHLRRISGDSAKQGSTFDRSLAKVGIKFNLAAILKQSQIFTSTLGSLFQIFGAVADIILAAFMPILIPAIRWVASSLPEIKDMIQTTVGNGIEILLQTRDWVKENATISKTSAANFLESLGVDGKLANQIVNAQKEAAIVAGGAGAVGIGSMIGSSGIGKLGRRSLQAMGIWEAVESIRDKDPTQIPEAMAGVTSFAALAMKKGRVGVGAAIGSQIIEYFRELIQNEDKNIDQTTSTTLEMDGKPIAKIMMSSYEQEILGLT